MLTCKNVLHQFQDVICSVFTSRDMLVPCRIQFSCMCMHILSILALQTDAFSAGPNFQVKSLTTKLSVICKSDTHLTTFKPAYKRPQVLHLEFLTITKQEDVG